MMKRMMVAAFAVVVAVSFMGEQASAQCSRGGGGYYGGGVSYYGGGGYYGGSGLSIGYTNYSPRTSFSIGYNSFPSYGYPTRTVSNFQSRGHYDYHPTSLYRHCNHFHVQPGHYDYHRGRHHR